MKALVTGFNGKTGHAVAMTLKDMGIPMVGAVRDVEKAKLTYGDAYELTYLDFSDPTSFETALTGIDRIYLMYPPGENIQFTQFLDKAKEMDIHHITYLSLKDIQFMPFIHHYKNEKSIKKLGVPYTFIRAGYFMQNLTDFLYKEIKERHRIFVPAGKGKTSFVDARDIALMVAESFINSDRHANKTYVITGPEALDFYEVAEIMTAVLGINIEYANPSAKKFKQVMKQHGQTDDFINIVVGVHAPTKLGLAKGIRSKDFTKVTGQELRKMREYIGDHKESWL